MDIIKKWQQQTGRKGLGATEQIMLLVVLVVVALILIWIAREYLLKRGGETAEGFIRGVNDFDGDGVRNTADRCAPAACDPAPYSCAPGKEGGDLECDERSPRYGCREHQGITLELYADTCNRREETNGIPEDAS